MARTDEALAAYTRALAIHQRRAPDSPEVADTLANLGVVAIQERGYARALPLCERAVALREERLGPEHGGGADGAGPAGDPGMGTWPQQRAAWAKLARQKPAAKRPGRRPEVAAAATAPNDSQRA